MKLKLALPAGVLRVGKPGFSVDQAGAGAWTLSLVARNALSPDKDNSMDRNLVDPVC